MFTIFNNVKPWIIKRLDKKLMITWDVSSVLIGFSHWFLEVDVTNGVSMFILLNRIYFDFSLFSHSDSFVNICNHCIAQQTCLSHNRVFEVTVVDLRLDVFRFVENKQPSENDSLFSLKFAMHYLLNQDILV